MIAYLERRWPGEPLQFEAERLASASEGATGQREFHYGRKALAAHLRRIEQAVRCARPDAAAREARAVAALVMPLGLVGLAMIAKDVAIAAERGDPAALGATAARLARHGNRALQMIDALRAASG